MVKCMSISHSRLGTALGMLLAGLWLAGCASNGNSRDGYRDPYANDRGHDPYYNRQPGYIVIDRGAERLERDQRHETNDLEQEQNAEKRALEQEQRDERQGQKAAGEWDQQDQSDQKQERKDQKRVFKKEDRDLRKDQHEEWQDY